MYRDNKNEWRWVFYASGNGEEIAVSSESYVNKADCRRSVDIMIQQGPKATIFEPTGS